MPALDRITNILAGIAGKIAAARRSSQFTCGDCERNARCGLPPHDDCVYRAMQIERDGEYRPRPPTGFYPAVWPGRY